MNKVPKKYTILKKENIIIKKFSNTSITDNRYSEINKKLEDIINNHSFNKSDTISHLNSNNSTIKNLKSTEKNLNLENFLADKRKNIFVTEYSENNFINNKNNFNSNENFSETGENSKLIKTFNRLNLQLFNDDLLAKNYCFKLSNNIKQKLNKKYFDDVLYTKYFEDQNKAIFLDDTFDVNKIKNDLNKNRLNFGEKPEIINDIKNNDYNATQDFFTFEANFPLDFFENKNVIEKKEMNKIDEISNFSDKISQKKMKKKFIKKGELLQKKYKRKNNTKNNH